MVSGCAVVVELSNWPLVRLSGCLDAREFWVSLCWPPKRGHAGSQDSRRRTEA